MEKLANISLTVVGDLRRAERSINIAARDAAQFLVTAIDAAEAQGLSAAMSHSTVKAAANSLNLLVESQGQMAMRAHPAVERIGRHLGLTEADWGGGAPKEPLPSIVPELSPATQGGA